MIPVAKSGIAPRHLGHFALGPSANFAKPFITKHKDPDAEIFLDLLQHLKNIYKKRLALNLLGYMVKQVGG